MNPTTPSQPVIRTQGLTRHCGDLVTLGFADEAAAIVAAEGAAWALTDGGMGGNAWVERAGTTVRARAAGAADRVARFVTDLDMAGAPVRRLEVASASADCQRAEAGSCRIEQRYCRALAAYRPSSTRSS